MAIGLESLVMVGRRDAVLIQDRIADKQPKSDFCILLSAQSSTHNAIWIEDERTLETLSEKYPTQPIFGVWQVLLHNGLLNRDDAIYAFYGDDSQFEGSWAAVSGGVAVASGPITAGSPLFADGYAVDLRSAINLSDTDLSGLKLPVIAAEPVAIRRAQARKTERKVQIAGLVAAGAIVVLSAAADVVFDKLATQRVADAAMIRKQAAEVQAQTNEILRNKSDLTPDAISRERMALTRLQELSLMGSTINAGAFELNAPSVSIKVRKLLQGITFPERHAPRPDGDLVLVLSPTGIADSSLPAPETAEN